VCVAYACLRGTVQHASNGNGCMCVCVCVCICVCSAFYIFVGGLALGSAAYEIAIGHSMQSITHEKEDEKEEEDEMEWSENRNEARSDWVGVSNVH